MSDWLLVYSGFDPVQERLREALCTLGNGYVATRGATPEAGADDVHAPGTYFAGCYDRLTSTVAGREVENEDLVNAPNWLSLTFRIEDGDWFDPARVDLLTYRQELDLRRGILTRTLRFRDAQNRVTALAQRRLVSMDDAHLAALETTVVPENWSGRLEVCSALDGAVTNRGVPRYRALRGDHLVAVDTGAEGEEIVWLLAETATSRIRIAEAARTRVTPGQAPERTTRREDRRVAHHLAVDAAPEQPVTVEKTVALYTSRDRGILEPGAAARTAVVRAGGFEELRERHVRAWEALWRRCVLNVRDGAVSEPQRALHLDMFHLLQTLSPHTVDLDAGVPARGLHGEAYRGHVFWDELFVFPFLNVRFPEIARALLLYRWRRLPEARWAARLAGQAGAMYPWQSGSDGREETQRLHLNPRSGRWLPDNSHLQRHVGLAVAYNVWQYYQATGDLEFLATYGAEMLVEIARFWASLARYDRGMDRYRIRGVMGPDEYHDGYPDAESPGLDDNAYTNIMTVWVLRRALDALAALPEHTRAELRDRLDLGPAEIDRFADVSRKMLVPFHGEGIISQFAGYGDLRELDWEDYRVRYGDIRRLDRILEAEGDTPNRYRVSKQADVLMLFYLFSTDELTEIMTSLGYPFEPEVIPRTIDYYLARTAHGSTLSAVVHAWVLARSDRPTSWPFFVEALDCDIADVQGGTTAEGIHVGAMAGALDLAQRCYTGLEMRDDVLRLDPRLPRELSSLTMDLRYRGHAGLEVRCEHDRVRVVVRRSAAGPIRVAVKSQETTLQPGESWEVVV